MEESSRIINAILKITKNQIKVLQSQYKIRFNMVKGNHIKIIKSSGSIGSGQFGSQIFNGYFDNMKQHNNYGVQDGLGWNSQWTTWRWWRGDWRNYSCCSIIYINVILFKVIGTLTVGLLILKQNSITIFYVAILMNYWNMEIFLLSCNNNSENRNFKILTTSDDNLLCNGNHYLETLGLV